MKYKAVIFDLFGTLIDNFPWAESNNILEQMASELSVPAKDFTDLWHATFDERMKGIFQDYQACIRHICQQIGVKAADDKVELAAGMRFEMNKQEVTSPRKGATEVLTYLRKNGCKTGLISDCSTETTLVWKNSPLSSLIDEVVFSCLAGIKKPDPRIYQIAIGNLGVSPQACIYIADGIGQELIAASKFGMHAVQIRMGGDDEYDPYREDWDGPVISSLNEVMNLLE
ncbi:MAG: HAD family hydrolase [Dehalococcoidales bacterium]|nr:MAG: HAD family hydrolase [Dehalococcoidales bacterium]